MEMWRALLCIAILSLTIVLQLPAALASWSLEDQLRYYLKHVFGIEIPSDAVFYVKPLEPVCNPSTDVIVDLWACSKPYRVSIYMRGLWLNLSVAVGAGNKVIAIAILNTGVLRELNVSEIYVLHYHFDPDRCYFIMPNASSFLAVMMAKARESMELKGVKEYLGGLAKQLCAHGCSYLVKNISAISFGMVCPGGSEGSTIYLAKNFWIDVEVYAPANASDISTVSFGLDVELPRYGRYEVVEIVLSRIEGNRFAISVAGWKPYRIEVFKPPKELVDELAKLALKRVNSSIRELVPQAVDLSRCRASIEHVWERGVPRELPVNATTVVLEHMLDYIVAIRCRYNSSTTWVREVDIGISPYEKRILDFLPEQPHLEIEVRKLPIGLYVGIAASAALIASIVIVELRSYRRARALREASQGR